MFEFPLTVRFLENLLSLKLADFVRNPSVLGEKVRCWMLFGHADTINREACSGPIRGFEGSKDIAHVGCRHGRRSAFSASLGEPGA
ncbi:MAG TPA: hypothetical protein VKN63_11680, partial [Afifellaceae bacterium]|nr:hypothetical protein [Afifellaceae bacterium]